MIGAVLSEDRHSMLTRRCQVWISDRMEGYSQHWFLGRPTILSVIECLLQIIDRWSNAGNPLVLRSRSTRYGCEIWEFLQCRIYFYYAALIFNFFHVLSEIMFEVFFANKFQESLFWISVRRDHFSFDFLAVR